MSNENASISREQILKKNMTNKEGTQGSATLLLMIIKMSLTNDYDLCF